jgi:hypothetical protein
VCVCCVSKAFPRGSLEDKKKTEAEKRAKTGKKAKPSNTHRYESLHAAGPVALGSRDSYQVQVAVGV